MYMYIIICIINYITLYHESIQLNNSMHINQIVNVGKTKFSTKLSSLI